MSDDDAVEQFLHTRTLPSVVVGLEVGLFVEVVEAEQHDQVVDEVQVHSVLYEYLAKLHVKMKVILVCCH